MHRLIKLTAFAAGQRFGRDASGATAIEYALIASGLSIVIVVAVTTLGTTTNGLFQSVVNQLK